MNFKNRISAQREVLNKVNGVGFEVELFGLSSIAIHRWIYDNRLDRDTDYVSIVFAIAKKLHFLATRSQEQITDSYFDLSNEVDSLIAKLEISLLKITK